MTRIGLLGAMNRDIVVERPAIKLLETLCPDAPPLVETAVPDVVAQRGATTLGDLGAATYLGGSAFNVARILGLLNVEKSLDLAYFGIAGAVEGSHPHLDALAEWSFDTQAVLRSSLPPATCLAMVEPSGRTLLTALGANVGVADWLRHDSRTLIGQIAVCDIVHVTSFLDPAAPALIAGLLASARETNPTLQVSLDPGMAWLAPGGDGLAALLHQTNILHLNAEEFALLGGGSAVARIGRALASDWLILARTHAGATVYRDDKELTLHPRADSTDVVVVDANGAGDTFCGGFLWSYARVPGEPLQAAALGFTLARHKVGIRGPLTESEISLAMSGADW